MKITRQTVADKIADYLNGLIEVHERFLARAKRDDEDNVS